MLLRRRLDGLGRKLFLFSLHRLSNCFESLFVVFYWEEFESLGVVFFCFFQITYLVIKRSKKCVSLVVFGIFAN